MNFECYFGGWHVTRAELEAIIRTSSLVNCSFHLALLQNVKCLIPFAPEQKEILINLQNLTQIYCGFVRGKKKSSSSVIWLFELDMLSNES